MRRLDGIYHYTQNPEVRRQARRFGVAGLVIALLLGLISNATFPATTLGETGAASSNRLWSSGAELNSTVADMEFTSSTGTTPTIDATTKRSGGYAYRTNTSSNTASFTKDWATSAQSNSYWFRAYVRIATTPGATTSIIRITNGATNRISVRLTNADPPVLQLYNEEDSAQIGSDSSTLSTGTWYRVEVNVNTSTPSTTTAELRLDGVQVARSTSVALAAGIDRLSWGVFTSTTADLYFDDIAINGSTGRTDNWPGEGKIVHLLPNADGDNVAWVVTSPGSDYTKVDDPASSNGPNDNTDGLTAAAVAIEDLNIDSSSTGGLTAGDFVKLIEVDGRYKKCVNATGGPACSAAEGDDIINFRVKAAASGTVEKSSSITDTVTTWHTNHPSAPYLPQLTLYDLPGTSTAPWTTADLDSAQIGMETTSVNEGMRFTAIWMLVEYTPASGGRLFSSGFELKSATAGVEWPTINGSPTISSATIRSGTYSGRISSLGSGTRQAFGMSFKAANANGPFWLRTYFRATTLPSAENRIIDFRDSGSTARVYLTIDNTGVLKLYDEDGQLTGTSTLSTGTWYRIEVKIDASGAGATDTVEAKVDGAAAFASSATRDLTNGITQFGLGGNLNSEAQTTGDWFYDDVALNENLGSAQNSYPGAGSIVHLYPNATGDNSETWASTGSGAETACDAAGDSNYECLDEVVDTSPIEPDDAVSYIEETTTGDYEDFNIQDSSIGTGTVNLVSAGVRFRTSSATQEDFRVRIKDTSGVNAIPIESNLLSPASTTWTTNSTAAPYLYPLTAYTRPDLSAAWTDTELDSAQVGVRDIAGSGTVQVSTLWLLVDYIPPTITISGTCDAFDQTTDCTDVGTVKVAIDGAVQAQEDTSISGTWDISSVTQPSSGAVITVWIDAAASISDRAGAVTKYDGSGDVTAVQLFKEHLTIGSVDDQTVTNTNIGLYDNSVASGDDDVFWDVSAGDDLTVDTEAQSTQEELYIASGDTYRPASGGGGDTATVHVEIDGTWTADNNAISVFGSWQNDSTFSGGTSTTTFTSTTGSRTLSGTMTGATGKFYDLTFNGVSGGWTFSNAVETGQTFTVTNGAVSGNGQTLTVARNFTLTAANASTGYTSGSNQTVTIGNDMSDSGAEGVWSSGSTVQMTGTYDGNSSFTDITSSQTFVNLDLAYSGTTTTNANSVIRTTGSIHLKGGIWTSGGGGRSESRISANATPVVIDSGSSFTGTNTHYFVSLAAAITITTPTANANFGTWSVDLFHGASNGSTFKLGANLTSSGSLILESTTGLTGAIFDADTTNNYTLTFATLSVAPCAPSRTGDWTLRMRGGTHTFSNTTSGIILGTNCGAHTLDMGSSTVDVKGAVELEDGTSTITVTPGTGTLTWTHTSGSKVYTPSGETFYNITLNCSGGTVAPGAAVAVSNDLTMTAGTLSSSSNVTVNGSIVGVAGTFSLSGSAVLEQRVAAAETFGTTSGSTNWSILNLRFTNSSGSSATVTTNSGGTGTITVSSVMTVGLATDSARTVLDADARTWTLSGTGGDPLLVDDATTGSRILGNTSTFTFSGANGAGNTNVENNSSATYYNLKIGCTGLCAADTYQLEGVIDVDNDLTIQSGGTFDTVSGSNHGITVGGSWANSGTFTAQQGTVTFDAGSGSKTLSGTMTGSSAFYNVVFSNASGGWSFGSTSAKATNDFTITAGTVTGSSGTITIGDDYANSGTFTNNSGTVTIDSATGASVLSGTMTSGSAFYNLIFNYAGEVAAPLNCERSGFTAIHDFDAAATVSNLFSITSNDAVEFNNGSTYTVNDMNWNGNPTYFRNSAESGSWLLNVTATGNAQDKVSYIDVSRSDASGGATIIASDGTNTDCGNNTNWQFDEILTLSFDSTSKNFGTINGGDTPADQTTTLTATSNSSTGYTIYGWTTTKLRMTRGVTDYDIDDWTGTNASPTTWSGGSYGFGYNTDDTSLTGGTANRFSGSKYAAWVHAGYGDPVADRTAAATAATNTISYRFYPDPAQTAGTYTTTVIYVITANFP